ncbi:helix-turn-helix transcriptional regulator [Rhodococcus sp. NPDC006774]|uniref:helix-turn-helix transcriptional regulator n=1 Tax=Rhodococcus sp. NPDC006774 TaxID=3157186 RepID=UPI0033F96671
MSRRILRGFRPERLIEIRKAQGFSSRGELARQVGVSASAVAKWESGQATPGVDTLARVAAVLSVSMATFIDIPSDQLYLGDLRALAGLTQPQLAARIGFSSATVADLERGHATLSDDHVARLIDVLGTDEHTVRAAYRRVRERPPNTRA